MRRNISLELTKDDFEKEKAGHRDDSDKIIVETLEPYIEQKTLANMHARISRFHEELFEVASRFMYNRQNEKFLVNHTPLHYPPLMVECIRTMLSQVDQTTEPRRWPIALFQLARRTTILRLLSAIEPVKKSESESDHKKETSHV